MHPSPQSRDERVTRFVVFERDLGRVPHGLRPAFAGDDDFPRRALPSLALRFRFRQIPRQHDLLHPRRDVRQLARIDRRDLHPAKLQLQIPKPRLSNLIEQLDGNRLRSLLARDRPHRASAEPRDRLQHDRLERAADADRMKRRTLLVAIKPLQPIDESLRIGIARGDNTVPDIDDLRAIPDSLQH